MIDEDPITVIVRGYDPDGVVGDLLDQARAGDREALRELRGYMVPLPRAVANASHVKALFAPVIAGQDDLWEWQGPYDSHVGLDVEAIGEDTVW